MSFGLYTYSRCTMWLLSHYYLCAIRRWLILYPRDCVPLSNRRLMRMIYLLRVHGNAKVGQMRMITWKQGWRMPTGCICRPNKVGRQEEEYLESTGWDTIQQASKNVLRPNLVAVVPIEHSMSGYSRQQVDQESGQESPHVSAMRTAWTCLHRVWKRLL